MKLAKITIVLCMFTCMCMFVNFVLLIPSPFIKLLKKKVWWVVAVFKNIELAPGKPLLKSTTPQSPLTTLQERKIGPRILKTAPRLLTYRRQCTIYRPTIPASCLQTETIQQGPRSKFSSWGAKEECVKENFGGGGGRGGGHACGFLFNRDLKIRGRGARTATRVDEED